MEPRLIAEAAALALNGALRVLLWLKARGASHVKLRSLLQTALDENRDVSPDEVQQLIGEAQTSLDELAAEIEARRAAEAEGKPFVAPVTVENDPRVLS